MAAPVSLDETALISSNDGSTTIQSEQRGRTTIANGVVAKIAGLAAREIEGVHDLVSTSLGQTVAGLARAVTRQQAQDHGVSVEVGQREAAVDLRVIVEYGANIPAVADAVRRNITNRVESMTGLLVKEVNITVIDLYFPGDPEPVSEAPRVQ